MMAEIIVNNTERDSEVVFSEKKKKEMSKKVIKFKNESPNENPKYACVGDSGFDLRAWIQDGEFTILKPLERKLIHTGIYCELPEYTEIQVRPRSGLAIKKGITVLNTPGTVDQFYNGELCVILINLSNEDFVVSNGDRIAQAVLMPVYNELLTILEEVDEITENDKRGSQGFGHSGK